MPDFTFVEGRSFQNDFSLKVDASYRLSVDEESYLRAVNGFLKELRLDGLEVSSQSPSILVELDKLRARMIGNLRQTAIEFASQPRGAPRDAFAKENQIETTYCNGVFNERKRATLARPFEVVAIPSSEHGSPTRPINDIDIRTRDVTISEAQQNFKVEVEATRRIIKVVVSGRKSRWSAISSDVDQRLDEYMFALLSLTQVGLMNLNATQIPFASLALKGLQQEFVDREAGRIKNAYIFKLGCWAFILGSACVAIFYGSYLLGGPVVKFKRFFLLAAGAALGTWLSFSLRKVNLQFADLASLEDDRLNPGVRIIFVISLTTVVGLLFWTDAIAIKLGNFSSDFHGSGIFGFLIGTLCGISERALATAVSKRAIDFTTSIGGTK